MLALAVQVDPPPAWVIADHNPGPWFLPVARGDRLTDDDGPVIERIRDATAMFNIAIVVCVERATAGPDTTRDRRLLARILRKLLLAGVRETRVATERCAPVAPPRGVDGVMLNPVPR